MFSKVMYNYKKARAKYLWDPDHSSYLKVGDVLCWIFPEDMSPPSSCIMCRQELWAYSSLQRPQLPEGTSLQLQILLVSGSFFFLSFWMMGGSNHPVSSGSFLHLLHVFLTSLYKLLRNEMLFIHFLKLIIHLLLGSWTMQNIVSSAPLSTLTKCRNVFSILEER